MMIELKHLYLFIFSLASSEICYAGSRISVSTALEPAFYSTGDYKSFLKSASLDYWLTQHLGIATSFGRFEFLQDRGTWFTSVRADVYGFEAILRSKEWNRQKLKFGLGLSWQNKVADETFLELASKDSTIIQKFQSGYMNTPLEELKTRRTNFRMRTAIRDEDGYYKVGVSQVRDYSLYGTSTFLTYSVNVFGNVWADLTPRVRYYPREPLYIWSFGFGVNIPLYPG